MSGLHIGIDFDNTLASYDHLFVEEAGMAPDRGQTKKDVRDAIRRASEDGEERWQHLQARVYAHRMADAVLMEGAGAFLELCKARSIPVAIVSHKTQFARRDPDKIDLRQAALAWMEKQGFFDSDGFGLSRERVYFEATRGEKIARIESCRFSDFIDDLEEVFSDAAFPEAVRRHLFAPQTGAPPDGPFHVYRSWEEIARGVL